MAHNGGAIYRCVVSVPRGAKRNRGRATDATRSDILVAVLPQRQTRVPLRSTRATCHLPTPSVCCAFDVARKGSAHPRRTVGDDLPHAPSVLQVVAKQ